MVKTVPENCGFLFLGQKKRASIPFFYWYVVPFHYENQTENCYLKTSDCIVTCISFPRIILQIQKMPERKIQAFLYILII